MDNKTKLRLSGLILLTTAVLSLIIVLIVDSWPLAILLAAIIVAARAVLFGPAAVSSVCLSNV